MDDHQFAKVILSELVQSIICIVEKKRITKDSLKRRYIQLPSKETANTFSP